MVRESIKKEAGPLEDLIPPSRRKKLKWYGYAITAKNLCHVILQDTNLSRRENGMSMIKMEDYSKTQMWECRRDIWREPVIGLMIHFDLATHAL